MTLRRPLPLAVATLLFGLATVSVRADLLVLKDGSRLETKGRWQEKGRQVVFTDATGKLCALRSTEVDLAASRAATAQAANPAPAAAVPAERPVVLVLDENDVGLGSDPDDDFDPGPRQVVLFAADWCSVCRKTQAYFDQIGVAYERRDVDADPAARFARDRRSGGRHVVPVVDWGGEIVIGFDGGRFAELAREDRKAAAERERKAAERERNAREAESEAARRRAESAPGESGAGAEPPSS